ncbi:plasmid mobilization protein [Aeromonas caviae]
MTDANKCTYNKKNGRIARPDLRRLKRFSLYLSESEFEQIRLAAIGEHNTVNTSQETARQMSDFIRQSALNQPIAHNRSVPSCNIEMIKIIGSMSNNLNQAMRLVHAHAANNESSQIDIACKELLVIIVKMKNYLLGG